MSEREGRREKRKKSRRDFQLNKYHDAPGLTVTEEAEVDMVSAANAAKATYGSIHFPEEEFLRSSSRSELLSQAGPGQLQAATIKGDIWGVR